jgi:hypothetical protein
LSGPGRSADAPQQVADLGVGEGSAQPAEVLAGGPALGHRVGDPFACNLQLQLGGGLFL